MRPTMSCVASWAACVRQRCALVRGGHPRTFEIQFEMALPSSLPPRRAWRSYHTPSCRACLALRCPAAAVLRAAAAHLPQPYAGRTLPHTRGREASAGEFRSSHAGGCSRCYLKPLVKINLYYQ